MTKQSIYEAVGTSRQAHAAFWKRRQDLTDRLDAAEAQLITLRHDHPGLGLKKAWKMIQPEGVGRDRFCHEMTWRGHALDIKRSYIRVTRSGKYRFPNLAKGLIINSVNQVWQSDTTYYRIGERFYYITFIIDVYSRRIVGAHASQTLRAEANLAALHQAFTNCGADDLMGLIFHSDGGTQYRSRQFVEALRDRGISSSMCDVALDNAYAERLNGIIKQEYLDHWKPSDFKQLRGQLKRAVANYNQRRIHGQLPLAVSPDEFTEQWQAAVAESRYALRIKDGQGPNEALDTTVVQQLVTPGKYAFEARDQLLPADVIFLPLPTKKKLCKAA